jgi:hypothetical protein
VIIKQHASAKRGGRANKQTGPTVVLASATARDRVRAALAHEKPNGACTTSTRYDIIGVSVASSYFVVAFVVVAVLQLARWCLGRHDHCVAR